MERAWEGIINVHKWHLKNAVLNYCEAVAVWRRKLWCAHLLFFGNTFHLWLSHVISAWAAAARCLGSLPLPLLSPAGILIGKYIHAYKGNGFFWCVSASCASAWALHSLWMSLFTVKLYMEGSKQAGTKDGVLQVCSPGLGLNWASSTMFTCQWCNPLFCLC